jgi:long-chain acyl-CoA synthetase
VKIGAIAVPLDTRYPLHELASLFSDSKPRIVISESPTMETVVAALPQFKYIEQVIEVGSKYEGQFPTYEQILTTSPAQPVNVEVKDGDTAHIAYTSGSTGHPKGVVLSHGNLVAHADSTVERFQQTDKDISVLFALPLYHAFGLEIIMISSVYVGSQMVILPGLSVNSLMETIEREGVTLIMGVPYIFGLMVNWAEKEGIKHDISSFRYGVSGGSALPNSFAQRFKQHFGLNLIQIWGLTEGIAHDTCQAIDGSEKPGSSGQALKRWEMAIVDDNGRRLPANTPGEVILRGPFMTGIYNNPEATAATIKDGWLYTGDIGRLDEDGEIFILGRKKDIIIIKGQNIHPIDIEDVLYRHPQVAEAAVVGIDDEVRGERTKAFVVLKDGQTATDRELKDFCREYLARYKIPHDVVFVDSLPRTSSGKVRKEDLKQRK